MQAHFALCSQYALISEYNFVEHLATGQMLQLNFSIPGQTLLIAFLMNLHQFDEISDGAFRGVLVPVIKTGFFSIFMRTK